MRNEAQINYNFGAGPACLPQVVLNQIREDIPNWYDGMSVMEISHRLPVFSELTQSIESDLRQLLSIPDDFVVLFMPGGARTQYSLIPLNLLHHANTADYLATGHWSNLAYQDALRYCKANLAATDSDQHFIQIPPRVDWKLSQEASYVHYADNETIHGVEFQEIPEVNGKWLVCDVTSNILSKSIDFSRFGLIYASAQKNLGIAGISVVIVRKELLGNAHPLTPPTLNYSVCAEHSSMINTPPVFAWYVLGLVLNWVKASGGISFFSGESSKKSQLIYETIDSSDFYINPVKKESRSRINIPFRLKDPQLESLFLQEAEKSGLKQLKGHKVVGACRASLYNAMPLKGVEVLVDFMKTFQRTHG